MKNPPVVDVVIPALNEERALALVLNDIPEIYVREIIVADNNSADATAAIAREHGATVVFQPVPGYGGACLKALEYIAAKTIHPDIVVFLDADYSDHPEDLPALIEPILKSGADLVIGSRSKGIREKGSMTFPQVFGNWLATKLIKWIYGYRFSDLGPFRAIRYEKLVGLKMKDTNFGWTVEMQIKAAQQKLVCLEIPVNYRRRVGISKVSGTVRGTLMAGYKILYLIFKYSKGSGKKKEIA